MVEENKTPTVWASLGTTINIGNFENYKIDLGIAGVPVDASPELTQQYIEQGKKTLYAVVMGLGEELGQRMKDIKG